MAEALSLVTTVTLTHEDKEKKDEEEMSLKEVRKMLKIPGSTEINVVDVGELL